jgi:hypothetical protein
MRTKCEYRTASKKAYSRFKKKTKIKTIDYQTFIKIIYYFNESFRDYILETGEKIKYPNGVGEFTINKKIRKKTKRIPGIGEINNLPIDWKKTKEYGKIIYILNHHSSGYYFGWLWVKSTARFDMADLWYFKPTRQSSRAIAHYVKTDENYQHLYKEWKR